MLLIFITLIRTHYITILKKHKNKRPENASIFEKIKNLTL